MKKTTISALLTVVGTIALSWSAPVAQATPQAGAVTALVGGTLIDGFGGTPIHNSVILVRGERITAVGTVGTLPVPEGAQVISTEGMSVLPGLWDMHVHLMINGHSDYTHWDKTYPARFEKEIMPASANQLLRAGVTSARDLGAPLEASINVRERINRGEIPGPRLFMSGPFIQKAPYPGTEEFRWGVNGADDARAKVKKLASAAQPNLFGPPPRADRWHGLRRPRLPPPPASAGVDVIKLIDQDQIVMALIRERTAQMSKGPFFWTPTVQGLFNYDYLRDNPESLDDPSWQLGLGADIVADIRQSLTKPGELGYFQLTPARKPTLKRKITQLREAGVTLLIGTDSGIPTQFHSQSTWNELDVWVREMGIPPMEAIRSATYWPSLMMKKDRDVGTITPGKYADIIAVRGDVLKYINLLQRVDLVIKNGQRVR